MKDRCADQSADVLYPVILVVPPEKQYLRGRARADDLSRRARHAVRLSARWSGLKLERLEKNDAGRPLPHGGTFWSLSHKLEYVAGVAARNVTGIDIEKIRPCSTALCRRIADEAEWRLAAPMMGRQSREALFFRFWTAKEAVLKAEGVGLRGLAQCSIRRVIGTDRLVVACMTGEWPVEHFFFNGHIVSVVVNAHDVRWSLADRPHAP